MRPVDPDPAEALQMMDVFRPMLLEPKGMLQAKLELGDAGVITLVWSPCGLTAGVGIWMDHRQVLAASLLKSGLDRMDDSRAISMLLTSRVLRCSMDGWSAIARSAPPLLVNLYRDDQAMGDMRIALGSTALAGAFFGLLGISVEEVADDEGENP